jgi:hypothetical protein
MSQRFAAFAALLGLLALGVLLTNGSVGAADTVIPGRISFQIATGSTAGTNFSIGQAIAGLVSHPPGVGRCETATVCGPAGVILSARTSDGSFTNLRMVNGGLVDSAIAQGDAIAEAVAGRGAFHHVPQNRVRVIAALYIEQVHLVAMNPGIKSIADLRGKRVLLGNSGTGVVSRQILAAFRVPERSIRNVHAESGAEASMLASGKADAMFVIAGAPLDAVKELLVHGAHLVPIDGPGRERLVADVPQLSPSLLAGAYPGAPAVETVAARAYWITRDSTPDALIYGLTRALFNPANHAALMASHFSARDIGLDTAAKDPPAPLHPGAARFYREMGKLSRS